MWSAMIGAAVLIGSWVVCLLIGWSAAVFASNGLAEEMQEQTRVTREFLRERTCIHCRKPLLRTGARCETCGPKIDARHWSHVCHEREGRTLDLSREKCPACGLDAPWAVTGATRAYG